MKVYDGSNWLAAYASLSGTLVATANLSDLVSASAARGNLGLGTAATSAATDFATAAQADQTVGLTGAGATTVSGTYPNFTITSTDTNTNTTYSVQDGELSQNNFTDADHSKLDGIEASAQVTDTATVRAAGALMDSEVANLAQVKAFDSADYATAAQGTLADSALQTGDKVAVGIATVSTASSLTATVNTHLYVSAAGQTITLPASPTAGQRVLITVGNFTDTVVARNGSNIMGDASDMTLDTAYLSIEFIYVDATRGWVMT
jgi:hypothetical protein|tara:strand:- start:1702 stop:2490 length:789 start_codon:yes stop_codon:yes gene_type:complete